MASGKNRNGRVQNTDSPWPLQKKQNIEKLNNSLFEMQIRKVEKKGDPLAIRAQRPFRIV